MANQWQFGVYGHVEDAGDEISRKCILRVQAEYRCSASAAIKYICTAYAQGIQPVTYAQDNSEVLAAIAELSCKIDNISAAQAPAQEMLITHDSDSQSFMVVNSVTGEESTVDIERVPVDVNSIFAAQVKKAMRPGMRLES